MIGPELPILEGPIVLAQGTVDAVPWQVDAAVTGPTPEGDWWEHGPVGPSLAFGLGEGGAFGGGGGTALLGDGIHVHAGIHFFGAHPSVIAWVGVVSDDVASLEIRLDDGDRRAITPRGVPLQGFALRAFWCFPPRGATGKVVALTADGRELQSDDLLDVEVGAHANAGTGVGGVTWRDDRPPPGWPEELRTFGPGEGPRRGEDFSLHEAGFPMYVVPPDRWAGSIGLSSTGSSATSVHSVAFGYFDRRPREGELARGFEVTSSIRQPHPSVRPPSPDDVGTWFDERLPPDDVVNFVGRFLSREVERALQDDRGWADYGAVRLTALAELEVEGTLVRVAEREYHRLPQLRELRFRLPPTEVILLGWSLPFDQLEGFAAALERLELGTDLFRGIEAAHQEWMS
jgi:hypothetical protein